jgi:beta-galactosidase GanA
MKLTPGIPYGASYPPLVFDESGWEKDLELMVKAGMDIVRIGDVGVWDRIEAEKGVYQLDTFQRFYALAQEHGIQVMLSTGTCSPPLWIANEHPESRIKSSRGELYPLGASYHWACIHNPEFLDACERYINELTEFAVKQPNHFGWQITNEIGFPFNPTRESGDIDLYCYCDHSKNEFQEWLKEKYGSIEKVTEAWSWGSTNFEYREWSDLFAPEALPITWSSVTRWLDWRLFWQQAFTDHAAWEHELIRKTDLDHPTSLNIFNFKGFDRFGTYTGLDQWKKSKVVDFIGYDLYPGSGNKLASRPEHSSMFLDHGRSVSQFAGSDFWIHELESGPIGGWLLGPDHNTNEKDILNMCFESLGHDAKLVIYMPWREWRFQPLHWGAIVDLNSNPTPRYDAASLVGQYIQKNSDFLKEARVRKGEVALLESKSNAIVLRGMGQEEQLFQAQRGAYRAFWEKGYRVDFISEAQLFAGEADSYQIICLPLMGLISKELAEKLKDYVSQGGILIGFARCGTLDNEGWFHHDLPFTELSDIFGIDKIIPDHRDDQGIIFGDQMFHSWLNRDIIDPREGTEILATFEDDLPAITSAAWGKGLGIYLATQADGGYLNPEARVLLNVLDYVTERKGISPDLKISCSHASGREIDPHVLQSTGRTEILITNYVDTPTEVDLTLKESQRKIDNALIGLIDQEPLKIKQSESEILLSFKLDPKEVQIISINWK